MLPEPLDQPLFWVAIAFIGACEFMLWRKRRRLRQEPPVMKVPKLDPSEDVGETDPIRPHLFELIAAAVNNGAAVRFWNLKDLRAGTTVLGNWRITVEKIED